MFDENILRSFGGMPLNTDTSVNQEINVIQHSPHYDIDQLVKLLKNKSDQFSILSLNIKSINHDILLNKLPFLWNHIKGISFFQISFK